MFKQREIDRFGGSWEREKHSRLHERESIEDAAFEAVSAVQQLLVFSRKTSKVQGATEEKRHA